MDTSNSVRVRNLRETPMMLTKAATLDNTIGNQTSPQVEKLSVFKVDTAVRTTPWKTLKNPTMLKIWFTKSALAFSLRSTRLPRYASFRSHSFKAALYSGSPSIFSTFLISVYGNTNGAPDLLSLLSASVIYELGSCSTSCLRASAPHPLQTAP
ncbi:hypothetical protein KC19_9G168000 [Ceratodon purpureus]|uniref:Uncharacterized protein n=1 Tax=Ceratodon purpureus TaxID=3225 RepID=A0A8T0GST0_CERPU|nr:hypothetical protein KC19_9G168000 [Ceratodon purpureus]